MHTFLDVLHVVTAVFIVGPMAILPMTAMRAARAGHAGQVLTLARSTLIFSLASLVVVVFGFGVMGTSRAPYQVSVSTPWILISLILYVAALALSVFAVVPAMRSAGEHLRAAGSDASGSGAAVLSPADYRRIAMTSGVVALLLVVVVVLMVAKP